ncbi:MAG: dihydropteroate synthase [Bryobacterales bacterium]|nr:dihydropteroate synthase [Bryobacterales bacterium]MDE0294805.1 dihydropteroate synthase [Bryobacterales bacterium]MDE0433741.1 dihydropteroate synthase [Bryobacterales bacterium]
MIVQRQRYDWRIRDRSFTLGSRTLIMGVVSLENEGEGKRIDPGLVLDKARELERQGADLIELHAGPIYIGSRPLSADEELRKLVPVLRKLRHNLDTPVSINTYNAATAERAVELGVQIINDVSGLAFDAKLAGVINQSNVGLILTHLRGTPDTWKRLPALPDLVATIGRDMVSSLARARRAGIDRRRIVIDPGLELGKRGLENFRVLTQLDRLGQLQQPILVSPSRKRFMTESVRASDAEWTLAAAALSTIAIYGGAHIVRVHEVEAVAQAAKAADRVFELEN